MTVTLAWCFNEYGVPAVGIHLGTETFTAAPCPLPGHPGDIMIEVIDMTEDTDLTTEIRSWLAWAANPHDCLPSPICEVCGASASTVEQAMANAVMQGRLGEPR